MEALSAGASIASLAAITGQLVESAKALYDFWSSVKDTPQRLQWLKEDTEIFQASLQHIVQQSTQSPYASGTVNNDISQALQRCVFHVSKLETLVMPLRSGTGDGRTKRAWRSVKAVFDGEKIRLYRESLEAAKSTLLVVQGSLSRESAIAIESGVSKLLTAQPAIEDGMAKLITAQPAIEDGVARLLTIQPVIEDGVTRLLDTQPTIEDSVARLLTAQPVMEQGLVAMLDTRATVETGFDKISAEQSNVAKTAATQHENLQSAIANVHQDIRMIASSPASNSETLTPIVTAALERACSSSLENMVASAMGNVLLPALGRQIAEAMSRVRVDGMVHRGETFRRNRKQENDEFGRNSGSTLCRPGGPEISRRAASGNMKRKRVPISRRRITTPLGDLYICHHMMARNYNAHGMKRHECQHEFQISFHPRWFLPQKVLDVSAVWIPSPKFRLLGLNFQSYPIISSKSLIFTACENGEIATIKLLLETDQASIYDRDEDGWDLLMRAVTGAPPMCYKTCNFLLDIGCRGTGSNTAGSDKLNTAISSVVRNSSETPSYDGLDLLRRLVETERLEIINHDWMFFSQILGGNCGDGLTVLPVLSYLIKQEFFDFNLAGAFLSPDIIRLNGEMGREYLSFFISILLLASSDSRTAIIQHTHTLIDLIRSHFLLHLQCNSYGKQKKQFNDTVIAFGILLKNGLDPYQVEIPGAWEATSYPYIVKMTFYPAYLQVAWALALELNGWILERDEGSLSYESSDLESSVSDESQIVSTEESAEQESSVSSERSEARMIPGAWRDQNREEHEEYGPEVSHAERDPWRPTRFRFDFDDFDGVIMGYIWDPNIYSTINSEPLRTDSLTYVGDGFSIVGRRESPQTDERMQR